MHRVFTRDGGKSQSVGREGRMMTDKTNAAFARLHNVCGAEPNYSAQELLVRHSDVKVILDEMLRLREALEQIASCQSQVTGDVVSIARKTLRRVG